jgi:hypothetical protein
MDKTLSKMAFEDKGVNLIISGHFHSTEMTDMHFRIGSLCGGNAYSGKALQFYSRASIGLVLVDENNGFDGIKIDVQDAYKYVASYAIPDTYRRWFVTPNSVKTDTSNNVTCFKFNQ